jgi:hypothetical protein
MLGCEITDFAALPGIPCCVCEQEFGWLRTTNMSDSLALDPSSQTNEHTTLPARRFSFGAMFRAAMESLVAAHGRQFENSEPLFYRYPPV